MMEELQQALRCRAQTAMELLHEGIYKTEQKLEQCLHVLADVQEEVRQHQEAQVSAIHDNYNRQLQELTRGFEQQVMSLQQDTQAQLTDVQSASEAALHQAAQVLLEELQLGNPAQLAAAATAFRPSTGSPAASDMAIELSLAALQHHAETAQSLQQHMQGLQLQETAPVAAAADVTHRALCETGSNDAQHGSVSCCSRASTRSRRSAAVSEGADALGLGVLHSPVAAQFKQPQSDNRASLDALDTQCAHLQDQVGLQAAPEPPQQQQHTECCAVQAGWSQQQPGVERRPQEQEHSQHQQDWAETAQPADWPPANSAFSVYSPAGSAAVSSPSVTAAHAQSMGGLSNFLQGAWQGGPRSSSSSQGHSTHEHGLPANMARPARCSSAGVRSYPAFATPTDTPHRTQLWQTAGDNQAVDQQQQCAPSRELKALSSLPVTRQRALSQPILRRCVFNIGPPSVLLKSAASLRQQLESSWGAGLAKQAAKAAASSVQELQAGAAVAARLSRQHSRKASLAAGISSGSDSDEGPQSPSRRQQSRSTSARRSDEAKRWFIMLQDGAGRDSEKQPADGRVMQSAAGSSKRLAAAAVGSGSSVRRAGALCRSSSSSAGRLAGSSVLELLD